ncbi:UNVERIFIED_CONTAM: helix-turn-helix protein [Williamsia faeni]
MDAGELIRRWRDRLDPADAGITVSTRRRVPGVRREELAQLAGVSVDYLIRLEQGRATRPTDAVIGSLARALQLSRAERDHLFRAAGLLPPGDRLIDDHISPGVARILSRLGDQPLAVYAADWQLIRWTNSWAALLGDPTAVSASDRNLVRVVFTCDIGQYVRSERDAHHLESALVSDLCEAAARYPSDPRVRGLIDEMNAHHPRFAELWQRAAVGVHAADRKTISHPTVGDITLDCDVLMIPGSDLKLVLYSATPGSRDYELLEFLRVVEPVTSRD